MSRRSRREPEQMSPEDAAERWLDRKRADDVSEASIASYRGRLKLFWEWCDDIGIERVDELEPLDVDEYFGVRARQCDSSVTVENEMKTLRQLLDYLAGIDAVSDGLVDAVRMPEIDKAERSDETTLTTERAFALVEHYRNSSEHRASRDHALLELAWFTGARRGALRALDIRDVDFDGGYVDWVHRPETGTPLKNKMFGQRSVSLPEDTVDVLQEYVDRKRYDLHDGEGRQPLLTSQQGRPTATTVTTWSYRATLPCLHGACPHGKERPSCKFTRYNHGSKCPSSRSPHPIRSGSITWQLNCGLPPEIVAGRVNASIETIRWHYDWATESQRWDRLHQHRQQRSEHIADLTIES